MDRFRRSWQLFKTSVMVMQRDPRLLVFPIVTSVCTVLITLLFICPVAFQPTGHSYLSAAHWKTAAGTIFTVSNSQSSGGNLAEAPAQSEQTSFNIKGVRPLGAIYFALLYFVSMFCATFFNVAFYHQILEALNGRPVSVAAGLSFALSRWPAILTWTLFAGLVGYLIKTLEERLSLVGQIVTRLIGAAWSIACVFVVPVLITEETANPFAVLKKSAQTLTRTWGESLIGYAGVSFGGLIVLFISLAWLAAGILFAVVWHVYWLSIVVVLGWLAGLIVWSYIVSVASQIFRCALYLYAVQGALPEPYTQEMMALAWREKHSRKRFGF